MPHSQLSLFSAHADLPEGIRYQSGFISAAEEENLVRFIESLFSEAFRICRWFLREPARSVVRVALRLR
jgi:hypothetical protein